MNKILRRIIRFYYDAHIKKINTVSVIILTQNSEEYLAILLEFLRTYFSEIIVGVDRKSTQHTFDVAKKYTKKVFWIENQAGIVEDTIEQLVSHCSHDWVLRLDDDELISIQLIAFIRNYLPKLSVDAVGIHRKWCRVNLSTSQLEYSTNPVYSFDWQWRLFRKDKVSFNTNVHTPGISFCSETKAPLDGFIMHFDWVYRDFNYRQKKVARYESICQGSGHSDYYLYELNPSHNALFSTLFRPDCEAVIQSLIPFQKKSLAQNPEI